MKVALIQPNSPFLTNERVFPNMGLVRVATRLKHQGHDVELYDFSGEKKIPQRVREMVTTKNYDLYGFSATTPQMLYATRILEWLKRYRPSAKTAIGGPHATVMTAQKDRGAMDYNMRDMEQFDTIFSGEGEGDDVEKIFEGGWQKGAIIHTLDDVLVPDRTHLDLTSYHYILFGIPTTTIQTQRGCYGKCTFCCGRNIDIYKKIRMHSPERVVEELDELADKYGYTSFMWYDDEVNANTHRLEELCKQLAKRPYQHRGFVRSDQIARCPESIEWLKNAGFVKLCAGVESGSDRILKNIKKGITSEMNTEARKIIGKAGIHYEAFMMMGHPDETEEDIELTRQWLINNRPDDFDIGLTTAYPGSTMYDDALPSESFEGYGWRYRGAFFNKPRFAKEDSFYKGKGAQSHSDIRTKELSNKDLKRMRDSIEQELRR